MEGGATEQDCIGTQSMGVGTETSLKFAWNLPIFWILFQSCVYKQHMTPISTNLPTYLLISCLNSNWYLNEKSDNSNLLNNKHWNINHNSPFRIIASYCPPRQQIPLMKYIYINHGVGKHRHLMLHFFFLTLKTIYA